MMSTGRLLEHWHTGSMTRRASVLDALEPVAEVHVSPADLDALQISAGEQVQVETRRGRIELAARVDPKLPKGMIFVPFCFTEAPANQLTNPALDPFGKIPELKFSAARLSAQFADSSAYAECRCMRQSETARLSHHRFCVVSHRQSPMIRERTGDMNM